MIKKVWSVRSGVRLTLCSLRGCAIRGCAPRGGLLRGALLGGALLRGALLGGALLGVALLGGALGEVRGPFIRLILNPWKHLASNSFIVFKN